MNETVILPPGSGGPAGGTPTGLPSELVEHPRYRIVEELGAGGMGVVYKAEHRLMERTVALKVIGRGLVADADAIERFRREVRAGVTRAVPERWPGRLCAVSVKRS